LQLKSSVQDSPKSEKNTNTSEVTEHLKVSTGIENHKNFVRELQKTEGLNGEEGLNIEIASRNIIVNGKYVLDKYEK
jgi:hypothetical protein